MEKKQKTNKKKLWLRSGTESEKTTMLLAVLPNENGCKAVINSLNSVLMQLGVRALPRRRFLITQ